MRACLTFDDGPSEWTEDVVDLLAAHGVRATFFLIGANIAGREQIVERIAAHHEIGNHTFTHPTMTLLDDDVAENELRGTRGLIYEITGVTTHIWRAPGLKIDVRINAIAQSLGLEHVMPTIAPPDWRDNAPRIVRAVAEQIHDRAVIGLHDGIPPDGGTGEPSRTATVGALSALLSAAPVSFVPRHDLLAAAV